MAEDARQRLVAAIAGILAQVSREDVLARSISHFSAADKDWGGRVAAAVAAARKRAAR
jgi:catalase